MFETANVKHVRSPAVAGQFYPSDPVVLRKTIDRLLGEVHAAGPVPKALIVPHAGYAYSGPVAARGYALLGPARYRIRRVVLLGPSHYELFAGLATTTATTFATPLGTVPVDRGAVDDVCQLPEVRPLDEAHRHEHCLEVQLPFLQVVLDDFSIVPLVVGQAKAVEVADAVDRLWDGDETLLVISSDLSHYLDYRMAQQMDAETSDLVEQCVWQQIDGDRACGHCAISGLLVVAERRGLSVKTIDLRNSSDTSGDKTRVVGYGCFAVY